MLGRETRFVDERDLLSWKDREFLSVAKKG